MRGSRKACASFGGEGEEVLQDLAPSAGSQTLRTQALLSHLTLRCLPSVSEQHAQGHQKGQDSQHSWCRNTLALMLLGVGVGTAAWKESWTPGHVLPGAQPSSCLSGSQAQSSLRR